MVTQTNLILSLPGDIPFSRHRPSNQQPSRATGALGALPHESRTTQFCVKCIAVATLGLSVSALLRLATARYWDQELFFTSSLTWYIDNAEGLLTRRQGADVVPSNLGRF